LLFDYICLFNLKFRILFGWVVSQILQSYIQ
jgi:hypothetical protein